MKAHALFALLSDSRVWVLEVVPYAITSLQGPCAQTLSIKIAQKPYIIGSLGPKALKYESLEG